MCGIVAVIGEIDADLTRAFTTMLQLDVVRGKDSTGIVCVDAKGAVSSHKEAWLPQDFLDHRQVKDILSTANKRILIGHNRAATVGKVNKAGAHPFEFEKVIGVHNGTTPKYKFIDHLDFEVDSEAFYNHVNEKGIEDAWSNLSGAASLAFYNKQTKRFHLLRNKERPMYAAVLEGGKAMMFASEPWMIEVACSRSKGLKIDEKKGIKHTNLDTLYTFNPVEGKVLTRFSTRAIEPYKAPVTHFNSYGKDPILNTWATKLYDIRTRVHDVLFQVIDVKKLTSGQSFVVEVESTSTRNVFEGRVYVNSSTQAELLKDLQLAKKTGDEWRGNVTSCTGYGINQGFVLSSTSLYNVDEVARKRDDLDSQEESEDNELKEGLIIDNEDGVINRSMFINSDKVDSDCCACGDPLSYDHPETFKYIGVQNGIRSFICESCEEELADIGTFASPKIVRNIKEYMS